MPSLRAERSDMSASSLSVSETSIALLYKEISINNKIIMANSATYEQIIQASERDNYEIFCNLVDSVKSNNEFMFMLLLEVGQHAIISERCCDYLVNLIDLSQRQLNLCIVANLACLPAIFRKRNLTYDNSTRSNYMKMLERCNHENFDELMQYINPDFGDFSGTEEDLNTIKTCINLVY